MVGGLVGAASPHDFVPDRVMHAAPGEAVDLWIYAVLPKDGWVTHKPGDMIRADHPGSAIQYGGQIYELMRAEETAQGEYAYRYGLRRWDPQFTLRHLVNYTLESQQEAAKLQVEMAGARRLRDGILWLFPLAGLAPDGLQREWERKTNIRMAWVSAGSGLCGLALAFAFRDVAGDRPWEQDAVLYLAMESFARLLWITFSRRPHGMLLLNLPYMIWQRWGERYSPATRNRSGNNDLLRRDEVRRNPRAQSLQIISWYFDNNLVGAGPVKFEEASYRPLNWHRTGKGLSRRWAFNLVKVEPSAAGGRGEYAYPRTPERQKAVEAFTRRLDLAQSFALVWSTYPRRDQVRLAEHYSYQGARSTAMTAGMFLIVGILQMGVLSLLHLTRPFALACPIYLIFESILRLYKAKVLNQPAGSIVGYLLRLIIRPPLV